MISYRSIKKLLGETSLERKCRFLFGGGLMVLIAGSFYFYAHRTTQIVRAQNEQMAKSLVRRILKNEHEKEEGKLREPPPEIAEHPLIIQERARVEKVLGEVREAADSYKPELIPHEYSWTLTYLKSERAFGDDQERAWAALQKGENEYSEEYADASGPIFAYTESIDAADSCLSCHTDYALGDQMGVITIRIPMARIKGALGRNDAILLATAIVTAFLAMVAAYVIVRYVIVKPVLHLKDVSDEIARGTLDLRADINTGDEFEELSHAFNRMLRHLMTVQDELRQVNTNLDAKVDELAQVNLRLYETGRLKDDFLATITHELRTPLNSILGFSGLLSENKLNDPMSRWVDNIQTSGQNLMMLINDLLDLAKIESGKMDIQAFDLSLNDLMERQYDSLVPLAARKNIAMSWHVHGDVPLVYQDAGKLQQILNNLLSNAIKFTPEGGRVTLNAQMVDKQHFEMSVEDTGIGIPLHDQARIFEKFRQGNTVPGESDATTREYEGTGLGLSIVRELSKLLGGEVRLSSEFGKGSVFTVKLPIRVPEQLHEPETGLGSVTEQMVGMNRLSSVDLREKLNPKPVVEPESNNPTDSADASGTESRTQEDSDESSAA